MVQERFSGALQKASVKAVEEGTEYTTTEEETQYMISFQVSQENICFLQKMDEQEKHIQSDWKEIDGYWYNGAVEFGVKVLIGTGKNISFGHCVIR